MSCGCGKMPKGSFSPLDTTWTTATSLRMNSWDPYPELLPPGERARLAKEGYCNCSNGDCGTFKNIQNVIDVGVAFPSVGSRTYTTSYSKIGEKFIQDSRGKNNCGYDTLNQAWGNQKLYST